MHDDLKQRLLDEVAAEFGTRPSSDLSDVLRRGQGKRLALRLVTTMSLVLVGSALLGGGLWISQTISSPSNDERNSIQPAGDETSPSEPTPSETHENAEASGRRIDLLDGQVAFLTTERWREDNEWRAISDAPMGPESLLRLDDPSAGLLILTDPAPLQESCEQTGATVVSAEVAAEAIRANPGLSSTNPVVERVAGVDALRLDVALADGASTCHGAGIAEESPPTAAPDFGVPVITGTRETFWGQPLVWVAEEGKSMRLYLLDLPGGAARTVAIAIVAAEQDFDAALEAAMPILDSFEFHEANQ